MSAKVTKLIKLLNSEANTNGWVHRRYIDKDLHEVLEDLTSVGAVEQLGRFFKVTAEADKLIDRKIFLPKSTYQMADMDYTDKLDDAAALWLEDFKGAYYGASAIHPAYDPGIKNAADRCIMSSGIRLASDESTDALIEENQTSLGDLRAQRKAAKRESLRNHRQPKNKRGA